MCGIVGLIHTDGSPAHRGVVDAMTDAIAHRGPSGSGAHISGSVGLGNRRLAIIDLEGGKQPLCNEDQSIWITFNGEIYNYRDLTAELLARGHVFRTHSDTETIVHAYEEWGEACVERLRGMFAFAIHDGRQQQVFLARDQLGIKPLYYLRAPGLVAFSSELQGLKTLPGLRLTLNLQALDQYLCLQYVPAPLSIFNEISKLPPGHRMTIGLDGSLRGPDEYWRLAFQPDNGRSPDAWLSALDDVLRDSVRAHLVADVPFGAFLSGGLDSSMVVAYMSQIMKEPVRTFSIGFEESAFNELPYAARAAERWQTQHTTEIVRPDALGILPQLVRHYGEPFGDSSAVPTYYVSRLASRDVPMVLSGDGGDESFGGYDRYLVWRMWLSGSGLTWRGKLKRLAKRIIQGPPDSVAGWLRYVTYLNRGQRQGLWRPEHRPLVHLPLAAFKQAYARAASYSPGSRVQYIDLKTYLPYDILTKVDIASMIHSLEARTPLTDVRVVEFAATIPERLLMAPNAAGQWEGKLLLKKAAEAYYPQEHIQRPKMGFGVPIQHWFASGGASHDMLRQRLLGHGSHLHEYFEPPAIAAMMDGNLSGPLWLLLFLEEWLQQNKPLLH